MGAHREGVLEPRGGDGGAGSGIAFVSDVYLMMVVIANMLHEMVLSSKALCPPMTSAVPAWIFWIICAKRVQMAVQDVEPGEGSSTVAGIRLVLLFLGMAKEVAFGPE